MSQITSNSSTISPLIKKRLPSFLYTSQDQPTPSILKQSLISNFQHTPLSIMNNAPISQIIFYQSLATFIFVFGCSSLNGQIVQLDVLYVVFLLFAICLSGGLTGGNINPAVTLGNWLRKENRYVARLLPLYWIGQLVGCAVGLVFAYFINNMIFQPIVPIQQSFIGITRQIMNQMFGTFIMVFFILQITNPNTTFIQNQISGFLCIVVFFYFSIVLCPMTNSYAINLALIIGVNLGSTITQSNWDGWKWLWVYVVGEGLGVVLGVVFYDRFFQPVIKRLREARRDSLGFSQFTHQEDFDDQQDQQHDQN